MNEQSADSTDEKKHDTEKYHLNNINKDTIDKLKQFFSKYTAKTDSSNIYYKFYNINDLIDIVSSTEYIIKYNVIKDIINLICGYIVFVDHIWSNDPKYKSDIIKLYNTNDNLI